MLLDPGLLDPVDITNSSLPENGVETKVAQCNNLFSQSGIIAYWTACDLIFIDSKSLKSEVLALAAGVALLD